MESQSTLALKELLCKNTPLHIVIETEVNQTPFGQITFNVELQDGIANLLTLNIVKNRRIRYSVDNKDNK